MTRETAIKALAFITRIAPKKEDIHITFHGGEPLLAGKAFYEWILKEIRSRFGRRAHLSVQSNLWALDDEFALLLKKYDVSVGTSVDGFREMCDEQRGSGYYDKTKAGEAILHKFRMCGGEICTFAAQNTDQAAKVFEQAVYPYSIHGAVPSYGFEKNECCVDVPGMTRIFLDSYEAYKKDPAHCRISTIDAMARGCFEGKGSLCTFFDCLGVFAAISPDGGIYSCQRFAGIREFSLGNVMDDPDEEQILTSPAYQLLYKKQEACPDACGSCPHVEYCRGGCLYNSFTANTPKDPYCEAYRSVFNRICQDMTMEMGNAMLGKIAPTPILAMAGDQPHPYDLRVSRERMKLALEWGKQPADAQRFPDRFPEKHLYKFYLHVTFRCPLCCPHCYAEGGTRQSDELSPDRLTELIRQAVNAGFRSVIITGGEPLYYPEFDRLLELISAMDMKGSKLVLRSSFGFDIPTKRMKRICELFDEISVSVDGDRVTHDKRRGAGRYDRTIKNLGAACALRAAEKLSISTVLEKKQCDGEPGDSVRELASRLKISQVRMRPLRPLGRCSSAPPEAIDLCSETLDRQDDFHPRHSCGIGQNLYIEPDGSVFPCYAWCKPDKKLGDLKTEDLETLLSRGELYEYCRHDVDTNEKCRTCEVRYLCGGMCKAWAFDKENIDSGDFDCTTRKEYYTKMAAWIEKEA